MQRLLAHDPEERPSLEKLKLHPWMTAEGAASDQNIKQTVADRIMKAREEKRQERISTQEAHGNKQDAYKRGDDEEEAQFVQSQPFI